MGTLYIDRQDMALSSEGPRLIMRLEGEKPGSVPLSQLERVVVRARVTLASGLLGALAEHGIGLVILNARHPERTAELPGRGHNDIRRRLGQLTCANNTVWRTRFSRALMLRKLRAQRRVLLHALPQRPDERHGLVTGERQIAERIATLRAEPGDIGRIRGIEGAAAAAYFAAYCKLFAPVLDFTSRNRRPPRDPVNAVLSLGYTLITSDAVSAAHAAGLEPLLGFYHEPAFGRPSLACDLVEPLRPHIDAWVWTLFRERTLRPEHFREDRDACLLDKAGREYFYAAWETRAHPLRRHLRRSALTLAKHFAEQDV